MDGFTVETISTAIPNRTRLVVLTRTMDYGNIGKFTDGNSTRRRTSTMYWYQAGAEWLRLTTVKMALYVTLMNNIVMFPRNSQKNINTN